MVPSDQVAALCLAYKDVGWLRGSFFEGLIVVFIFGSKYNVILGTVFVAGHVVLL